MKNLLIIAALALTASCSTTKKLQRSFEQQTEQTAQNDIRTDQSSHVASIDSSRVLSSAVVEVDERIIRYIFDTSRPTDSITGLPPLKEAQIIDRKASGRSTAQSDQVNRTDSVAVYKIADKSSTKATADTTDQIDTQATFCTLSLWWLCGALLAVVVFLLWRKLKL